MSRRLSEDLCCLEDLWKVICVQKNPRRSFRLQRAQEGILYVNNNSNAFGVYKTSRRDLMYIKYLEGLVYPMDLYLDF